MIDLKIVDARKGGGKPRRIRSPFVGSFPSKNAPTGAESGHLNGDTHSPPAALTVSSQEEGTGHFDCGTQVSIAGSNLSPEGAACDPDVTSDPHERRTHAFHPATAGEVGADHACDETQVVIESPDLRFSDPLVAEIVQLHRMRRRWMKARNGLILQGKAFGRALCEGDKKAGAEAFDRVLKGKENPGDDVLAAALIPFIPAIERFDQELKLVERELEKMAKRLPVAPWVKDVRGLGWGSVAAIVGEAGDLSKYPSVAGVWKRLGLAVISGDGRQRKCANAEQALAHGYSPERRSVVWNMAEAVAKLQRTWVDKKTGEVKKPADPYGEILEREKAKALEKELTPSHAENRAKRHMSKAILRDLTVEWRRAVGQRNRETQRNGADSPRILEAAE